MATSALLDWLFGLRGPALKWDIETAHAFLARLGDPQRTFPALHVAGTNGKGSVAAMVHALALASGIDAGLTTSPHLVRPEERIRLGPDDIAPGVFEQLITRLRGVAATALEDGALPRHPSFFEMLIAAAFVAFAERGVGLAVVETGLGGRLDATNVIVPRVGVITTIGLDHVKALGGSLASIAREKAGIAKSGVPLLLGWIAPRPRAVIEEHAARVGAPVHLAARELQVRRGPGESFSVRTPNALYGGLRCALSGPHQRRNAALALRAAELLAGAGVPIRPDAARAALARVRWPARLERIAPADVVLPLPARAAFLLDGAHNVDGARALASALREDAGRSREDSGSDGARPPSGVREAGGGHRARRIVVFGVTEGRNPARLLEPLAPLCDDVIVTRPRIVKALAPEAVAADVLRAAYLPGGSVNVADELTEALALAARLAGDGGEVVVCGSLYLAGDARAALLGLRAAGHPEHETRIAAAASTG